MALGSAITGIAGAVLGGVGSAIGGSSASKAANKAADSQLAVARENNALAQSIYNQNRDVLAPTINSGNVAGSYLNAFLGLPTAAAGSSAPSVTDTDWAAYVNGNPDALANWNAIKNTSAGKQFGGDITAFGQYHYGADGSRRDLSAYNTNPVATGGTAVTQQDATNAFSSWLNNSDFAYQSALGQNQVNSGFAGSGALQSGAALKALQTRQNNINQGYQGTWMNSLAGQQGLGLGAASALAGVSTNYGAQVSANNQNAADASSNAALINGQNNPWANALSTIGGGLLGSAR